LAALIALRQPLRDATWSRHVKYAVRHLLKEVPPVGRRVQWLSAHERDDPEQLQALQERLLQRTLRTAARCLPAYAGLAARIPATDAIEFLRTLPVVDKQQLLTERERYYPHLGRGRPWHAIGRTSGTTGTPLEVFRSYDSTLWEQACCRQHWLWTGWREGQTQAVLRGDLAVPLERATPPFWLHDRIGRQLILSTRHLSRAHIAHIVEATAQRSPALLRAYPSAAYALAVLVAEAGLRLRVPAVVTSSEILLPMQREFIEKTLGTKVYDHYGMAERVAFGLECERGRLHVHPLYSYVETVDEHNRPTDGVGYVVGTTFHNALMPLVRYRLSDRARLRRDPCPCGRSYPYLDSLGGKYEDQLFDRDGNTISSSVVTFAFKGVPHIAKAQVAQVGPGRLEVRIVPMGSFGAAERERLLANFRTLVSTRIDVTLQVCGEIPLQASGKYKWVCQEFYAGGVRPREAGVDVSANA
jgi:phenylacetate-CoA ligase